MTHIEFTPTPVPNSPTGVYIPGDLDDCFFELDRMLPAGMIEKIKASQEDGLVKNHFGLGMWMRNNWGLWKDWSRLKLYFDTIGLHDADSVSSLIVGSYWRYLNDRPIELPRQIVYNKIGRDEIRNGPKTGNLS